jgi:hypothetical protein
MITIRVYSEPGRAPVKGKRVTLSTSTGQLSDTTGANGDVRFDVQGGKGFEVHVDCGRAYKGPIVGVQVACVR